MNRGICIAMDLPTELIGELMQHLETIDQLNVMICADNKFGTFLEKISREYSMMVKFSTCHRCRSIGRMEKCNHCNNLYDTTCMITRRNKSVCHDCSLKSCRVCNERLGVNTYTCDFCDNMGNCWRCISSKSCKRCRGSFYGCDIHSTSPFCGKCCFLMHLPY